MEAKTSNLKISDIENDLRDEGMFDTEIFQKPAESINETQLKNINLPGSKMNFNVTSNMVEQCKYNLDANLQPPESLPIHDKKESFEKISKSKSTSSKNTKRHDKSRTNHKAEMSIDQQSSKKPTPSSIT